VGHNDKKKHENRKKTVELQFRNTMRRRYKKSVNNDELTQNTHMQQVDSHTQCHLDVECTVRRLNVYAFNTHCVLQQLYPFVFLRNS